MEKFLSMLTLMLCFTIVKAQQAEVTSVKYEALEKRIQKEKAPFLIVNFWTTICTPCIKELPHFMEINNKYAANPNFKMILVSLDRLVDKERVIKFINTKNLTAEVILLDDIKRMNTWIPRFEKGWDGNIPVTLFYNNGEKVFFHEGEMSREELESRIEKYMKS